MIISTYNIVNPDELEILELMTLNNLIKTLPSVVVFLCIVRRLLLQLTGVVYMHVLWRSNRWVEWDDKWICAEWRYLTPCVWANIYDGDLRFYPLYLYLDNSFRRILVVLWGTTVNVWYMTYLCHGFCWLFTFWSDYTCSTDLVGCSPLICFLICNKPFWFFSFRCSLLCRNPVHSFRKKSFRTYQWFGVDPYKSYLRAIS